MPYSFSKNQWNEAYIEELNRADFTGSKSTEFFDRVLDYNLSGSQTLFLVIGSDSGLLLPYLAERPLGQDSHIAIIEHDDVYPLIAERYGEYLPAPSLDNGSDNVITLHRHSDWFNELFDQGYRLKLFNIRRLSVLESRASSKDYLHGYLPVLLNAKKTAAQWAMQNNRLCSHPTQLATQLRNAADNCTPMTFSGSFGAEKTALVVSAGPSMTKHLQWMSTNRDRLFILVVADAVGELLRHEIKPDLMLAIESSDQPYTSCKSSLLLTDVPLVHSGHVSPKLLQQWQGPRFFLGNHLPWKDNENRQNEDNATGPTASHAAVRVASRLGFSRILLSGVDFCYDDSDTGVFKDNPEQLIQQLPLICDEQVETYAGKLAGTTIGMKHSSDILETIGSQINADKPVLFNLSDTAVRCHSIPYCSAESIDLPANRPAVDTHFDLQPCLPASDHLESLDAELTSARQAFCDILEHCDKASTLIDQPQASGSLAAIQQALQKQCTDYLRTIVKGSSILSDEATNHWDHRHFQIVGNEARNIIDQIDNLAMRISLRKEELQPGVNIRDLAKRWREDETPGRILWWKRLQWQCVKAQDRAWVQRAIGKFRATLNEPSAAAKNAMTANREKSIDCSVRLLMYLRDHGHTMELEQVESRLCADHWPSSALKPFTAGLLAALKLQTANAIAQFQQSLGVCHAELEKKSESLTSMQRLVEASLLGMTECYTSTCDYQSSLATLRTLNDMVPSYLTRYASMLHQCNQTEQAIELLESCLEIHPENEKARALLNTIRPALSPMRNPLEDPAYIEKISGAMRAIMGTKQN